MYPFSLCVVERTGYVVLLIIVFLTTTESRDVVVVVVVVILKAESCGDGQCIGRPTDRPTNQIYYDI